MTSRENILRVVHFDGPEYIPMRFHISPACWHHYPQQALQELMAEHPVLFPNFEASTDPIEPEYEGKSRAGEPYTDPWGCVWETVDDGIVGMVSKHPLESWDAFDSYTPPDPEDAADWKKKEKDIKETHEAGQGLSTGGLAHGHTFLRLSDIRGYPNLLYDMADEEPRLWKLIEMVEDFNYAIVERQIKLGVEYMSYPEDLGMQVGPMLSPEHLRKYIKPSYQRLMKPARDAGNIVHMHSDGDIRDLVDDLIDGGVQVVNLQDLVNGIDWIREKLAGKVCIDLDVDRQHVTVRGTPAEIDALIREEVEKLGSKQGGLLMVHGLYPGVPLENVKALMDAMERYATYYS